MGVKQNRKRRYRMEDISKRLVDKSIEAFIMGLEIYNKPTIKYRIEGFSFFICNAWELMLKAELINRGESIYFPNDPSRSISLQDTISKIYTDVKQPLRLNLEEIISLRNTATHYITEDDEIMYAPFFQSNVLNFVDQIERFHNIRITDYISQSFLMISVDISTLSDEEINNKYSPETALKYISRRDHLEHIRSEFSNSNDLFIPIRVDLYNTKNIEDADVVYAIDNNSTEKIAIVKTEIEPHKKYYLTRKNIIDGVNKQLKTRKIEFNYVSTDEKNEFNDYTLSLIANYYNLYESFSYTFVSSTRYSQQLIDEIIRIIQSNPNVIVHIRNKQKKITPGS